MTQDELIEWVDGIGKLLKALAVVTLFISLCIGAGWLITKLERSEVKKTVPDCGSCRLYKGEKK
jgi:Na+-transporting methylmalonyl-CoA/oxaloacetate decarboxylase gamma subunit